MPVEFRLVPKEPSKETFVYFPGGQVPNEKVFRDHFMVYRNQLLDEGWKYLGMGRHRSVVLSPEGARVLKISNCPLGVVANHYEFFYAKRGDHVKMVYADTRRLYQKIPIPQVFGLERVGHNGMLSALCVEYVERTKDGWSLARKNPWIHDVDVDTCPQVGYTASGRLVCFDWARF